MTDLHKPGLARLTEELRCLVSEEYGDVWGDWDALHERAHEWVGISDDGYPFDADVTPHRCVPPAAVAAASLHARGSLGDAAKKLRLFTRRLTDIYCGNDCDKPPNWGLLPMAVSAAFVGSPREHAPRGLRGFAVAAEDGVKHPAVYPLISGQQPPVIEQQLPPDPSWLWGNLPDSNDSAAQEEVNRLAARLRNGDPMPPALVVECRTPEVRCELQERAGTSGESYAILAGGAVVEAHRREGRAVPVHVVCHYWLSGLWYGNFPHDGCHSPQWPPPPDSPRLGKYGLGGYLSQTK